MNKQQQQRFGWFLIFGLISIQHAHTQDISLYNHFYVDKTFYNASYAGEYLNPVIHMTYRQQWAGISGAPETMMVAGNYALPDNNLAFAGRIFRDKTGIFMRYGMKFTGAYGVSMSKLSKLNFGMSMGFLRNSIDWERINEQEDEIINDPTLYNVDNSFGLDGDFGMNYSIKNKKEDMLIDFGFALPQMFNRNLKQESSAFRYISHSIVSTSIEKYFGNNIFADATALYRIGSVTGGQLDVASRVGMFFGNSSSAWLSYLYRMDNGSTFGAGLTWQKVGFSFTYDMAAGTIGQYSGGSYELHMTYFFGNNNPKVPTRLDIDLGNSEKEEENSDKTEENTEEESENAEENPDENTEEESENSETEENPDENSEKKSEEPTAEESTSKYEAGTYEALADSLNKLEKGGLFVLKNTKYESGSSDLKPSSFPQLDMLATYLKNNPNLIVEIGGHTDNEGSDRSNMTLSAKRAKEVAMYLVKKGVTQDQIVSKGYGASEPITGNDDDEDQEINRRTELKVLEK